MTRPFTSVLLDLDGTLIDSAPGITGSLAYMFERMGRPIPSPADLLAYVGPPLQQSLVEIGGFTEPESWQALAVYRERYLEHGAATVTAYPGVVELVRAIRSAGIPMSLATSKPESLARLALTEIGLLEDLDVITGASEDEKRSEKTEIIALALERLDAFGADLSRPIMVGDRFYDVEGAAANGIPSIFATWGYGAPAEQVGSIAAAGSAAEVASLVKVAGDAAGR